MQKLPYKILTISWDPTLAMDDPKFGDVQRRNIEYGKLVSAIHLVTYSKRSAALKNKQLGDNVFVYPTNSVNQLKFVFDAYIAANKICFKEKIDLVLTQDPFLTGLVGCLIKRKFKCKFLIHVHGDFWHNWHWLFEDWFNLIYALISKFTVPAADAFRVMSERQKAKLIKSGIRTDKIRVIPTPVDLDKFDVFDANQVEAIKGRYPGKKIILFNGRLEKVKNFPTTLRAIEMLGDSFDNWVLLVIGKGRKTEEWKNLIKFSQLDDKIILLGEISHQELPNYYQACEFIVNSSTNESFGKIFVEAAACGKPAVAAATTGAEEIIIDGQTGLLSPIGDAPALSKNLLRFIENDDLVRQMGAQARLSTRERFDGEKNILKIVSYWREIIESNI